MSDKEPKRNEMKSLITQVKSFLTYITSTVKEKIDKKKIDKKEEKYDIGVDDIKAAHGNIPKRIGMLTIGIGLLIILIMTVMTVREQVSQVDLNRTTVDSKLLKDGEVEISIDEQGWKHFQSKRIDMVTEKTRKELNATREEIRKSSKKLQLSIKNDLNRTIQSVKELVNEIGTKFKGVKDDVNRQLKEQMSIIDSKAKKNIELVANMKSKSSPKFSNAPIFNENSTLLPPPLSNLSSSKLNTKVVKETKEEVTLIEPGSDNYDYMRVRIDDVDIETEEIQTALYIKELNTSIIPPKFHIMKGLVNATLLTGVSAPTFGGGNEKNRAPVLLSIDGDTVIANDENEVIEDCLISGSAAGNINTGKADILLTDISCSGYNKKGERIKIEQPIKGWVIGEDGSFGLSGRLLDSSGKVITKMIALEIIKSLSATLVASAQPTGSILTGSAAAIPYDKAAQGGLGTGVSSGLDRALEHYDQILTGMYPTISVRTGKKVSILLKGGEDATPAVYDSLNINNEFEVER